MSEEDHSGALRGVQTLFSSGTLGELTDRQLLERFANRNDGLSGGAFTILLERHGPMVWGVCCRLLLPDRSAAADAFQATFLVLLRKASAVRVDDSLGPWLYGVSRRVAARARATTLRRRMRETGGVEAVAAPAADPGRTEWLAIVDEEIGRLPEHQRAAVVLCDLECLPHEEAARRLGCPVGTVESRLSRGRQRLRDRLVRRGLAPATAALWAATAREGSAAMPAGLIEQSARLVASSPAACTVPVAVAALAEGVIQMMWLSRLRMLAAAAGVLILATTGVAVQGRPQPAPQGAQGQAETKGPPPAREDGAVRAKLTANQALAREQLELIDQARDMVYRLWQNGRAEYSSLEIWDRRKLETLRRSGAAKAEIIAALEKHITMLKDEEKIAEQMVRAARASAVTVLDARFRRMEAEIWLNEEKAR